MAPQQYPMLESCRVTIKSGVIDIPPVRLPSEILQAVGAKAPSSYDFSLEHKILKKMEEREKNFSLTEATSREQLEQNALARVKSVTNASDDVCISLLKSNSYDIKESIEAFLTK